MNYVKKKSRTISGSQFYSLVYGCLCLVAKSCQTLLQPTRLLSPWDFPSKTIGGSCHFHLQGNLPDLGIKRTSSALTGGFFITEPPGTLTIQFMFTQRQIQEKIDPDHHWIASILVLLITDDISQDSIQQLESLWII